MEIGAARDEKWQRRRHGLQHVTPSGAGGELGVGRKGRNLGQQIGRHGRDVAGCKQGGFFGVGGDPRLKSLTPLAVSADETLFVGREILAHRFAYEKMLIGRQAQSGAGAILKLCPTLAMPLRRAGDFGDTATDLGFGDDELRAPGLGALGLGDDGLRDRDEVMAVS